MNKGGANVGDFNHPKEDSGGQELGVKGNPKGPTLGDQKGGPETTGILGPETTGILGPESKSTIVAPSTAPQTLRHLDRKKQQFKLQQGAGFTNPQNNDNLNYDNTKSFMAVDSPAPLASGFLPYNPALLAAAAGVGFDSVESRLIILIPPFSLPKSFLNICCKLMYLAIQVIAINQSTIQEGS